MGTPEDIENANEQAAIVDAEEALLPTTCNTRAITLHGLQAKARALCMWDEDAIDRRSDYPHDRIRTSLLRDLLYVRLTPIVLGDV